MGIKVESDNNAFNSTTHAAGGRVKFNHVDSNNIVLAFEHFISVHYKETCVVLYIYIYIICMLHFIEWMLIGQRNKYS